MANPLDLLTDPPQDAPVERLYVSPYKADDVPVPDVMPTNNSLTQRVAPSLAPQDDDLMTMLGRLRDHISFREAGRALNTGVDAAVSGMANLPETLMGLPEGLVRTAASGLTAAHDVSQDNPYPAGSEEAAWYEDRRNEAMVPAALAISSLAGGGALTEKPGVATLGSGPTRNIGATAVPEATAPVFYSALEHATQSAKQDVMSPQQWQGYLKNQPGVKQEELQWTGVNDWLDTQKGKVSKSDVQSYLDENKVNLQDVTKGEKTFADLSPHEHEQIEQEYREYAGLDPDEHVDPADVQRHYEDIQEEGYGGTGSGTKYSSYQLPGGENYREHLLTMPPKPGELKPMPGSGLWDVNPLDYRSSHWDEPNVLAHVRTNDRLMARDKPQPVGPEDKAKIDEFRTKFGEIAAKHATEPGWLKNWESDPEVVALHKQYDPERLRNVEEVGDDKPVKSLHIEEIQSDWHQAGRKKGYETREPTTEEVEKKAADYINANGAQEWEDLPEADKETRRKEARLALKDPRTGGGVPDAPFKTSWPELALKRMIRHAAENGYDRISWTPGEAQAARYDLSKQIDKLTARPVLDQHGLKYEVKGWKGDNDHLRQVVAEEELPNVVGKEMAAKIVKDSEGKKPVEYKGLDLKVGGEGMREFYDKMLPKMAEKIGKAHGVKVKQGELNPGAVVKGNKNQGWHYVRDGQVSGLFDSPEKAQAAASQTVHYFDLPQSLKDQALHKGFPLYMSGVPFPLTPVDHDPFQKDKRK